MPAESAASRNAGPAVTGPAPLRVALWQPEAREETPADRLARLDAAMAGAAGTADLVVTPELFLSGYNRDAEAIAALAERPFGPSARAAAAMARRHGMGLVLGYPEAVEGGMHISALCLGPEGQTLGNYRKCRLMSDDERAAFLPGDAPCLVEIAGWRIGLLICWEIAIPEEARALTRAGAALIAVPTALRRTREIVARAVVPARAFENGINVAFANHAGVEGDWHYVGESVVAGPEGQDLARAGAGEEMVVATLDPAAPQAAQRALFPPGGLDRYQGNVKGQEAMLGRAGAGGA